MKSITIHGLDDSLEAMIQEKARKEGMSVNKTVKMLLRQALGLAPGGNGDKKADFTEFCGVWTEADAAEFERTTKDFREVDLGDWQ
jgi:hypothetical protein